LLQPRDLTKHKWHQTYK